MAPWVPRLVRRGPRVIVISPDAATPGYLPGDIEPGTWQVMIGLHRVPPGGAEYRLTVQVSGTPGSWPLRRRPSRRPRWLDIRPPRRELPAGPGGAGWRVTCTRTLCTRTA